MKAEGRIYIFILSFGALFGLLTAVINQYITGTTYIATAIVITFFLTSIILSPTVQDIEEERRKKHEKS